MIQGQLVLSELSVCGLALPLYLSVVYSTMDSTYFLLFQCICLGSVCSVGNTQEQTVILPPIYYTSTRNILVYLTNALPWLVCR